MHKAGQVFREIPLPAGEKPAQLISCEKTTIYFFKAGECMKGVETMMTTSLL